MFAKCVPWKGPDLGSKLWNRPKVDDCSKDCLGVLVLPSCFPPAFDPRMKRQALTKQATKSQKKYDRILRKFSGNFISFLLVNRVHAEPSYVCYWGIGGTFQGVDSSDQCWITTIFAKSVLQKGQICVQIYKSQKSMLVSWGNTQENIVSLVSTPLPDHRLGIPIFS